MKVCLVNYRYFVSGGPERYLFGLQELLEERGHEVIPFSVRYRANHDTPWAEYFVPPIAGDDEVTFGEQTWSTQAVRRSLERAFYSREVDEAMTRLLHDSRPDVVYVLNYLKKLSPAVLVAARRRGLPVVVRFSDYALVCPQPHLVRNGGVCELCVGGNLWPSVRHRCVKGSLGASAVNAAAMTWARRRGYFDAVDAFVAPSEVMLRKMAEGGVPPARLHHVPTFVGERPFTPYAQRRRRIAYAGRIDRTKGVDTLVLAYAQARRDGLEDVELVIAGDLGSPDGRALQAQLAARPIPGVRLVGDLDKRGVLDLLSTSLVSAVPSIWYENSPNALLESLACGTPVIASDLGSMRDILAGTGAGWLFPAGDAGRLAKTLRAALDDPGLEERGRRAQQLARTRHHPDHHVDTLLALFESVGVAPRLIADQRRQRTAAGETSRPGRRDSGADLRTELSSLPSGVPVGAPVSRK